jgi:hypothetical protein
MTGPRPQLLADRIRKARAQTPCRLCGTLIRIGNTIGRVPGIGWCHASCIVAANRTEPRKD